MTDLSYHLEKEIQISIKVISSSKCPLTKESLLPLATSSSEKSALEILLKQPLKEKVASASFALLKLLAATGRVFYQGKKVFIDPFTSVEIYFEGERQGPDQAQFCGYFASGSKKGLLQDCELVFASDPSWVLHEGLIRPVREEINSKWVTQAALPSFCLKGTALLQFLDKADGEVRIDWKTEEQNTQQEPLPILVLADRHGGFADLWFDYGAFGRVAAHDPISASFRNSTAEKNWEKDLLETDFIKKTVEKSHFYCPLDKVAKSLTFLLEIGWTVLDAVGRRVLREKKTDFDIDVSDKKIIVRTKMHYGDHDVDLKDLVGAFNRRESFVEISPQTVALIDRDAFSEQWGDLAEQEIVSEGILLKKNQMGILQSFLDRDNLPVREEIRQKIARLSSWKTQELVQVGKDFQGTLFTYQTEGLAWLKFLSDGGFGGLLADEMGLGKTVQVLAFFSLLQLNKPCLVVVPTSLLFNWKREIEKFLPSISVYRHEGKDRLCSSEEIGRYSVILTSYALLRIDFDLFKAIDFQVVALDEAQAIKNPDSQISECSCRLQADIRLAITGTPIENRLEDLWSIFRFLQPDLLGDRRQFQSEMQAAQLSSGYFTRMKKKIHPFLLRRKKDQVALQLPPKLEQTVFVEMTEEHKDIYDRWLQSTKRGLLQKVSLDGAASHRMEILEAILRLRQLCAHPWLVEERTEDSQVSSKFERLMADLREVVEENQKVLVYSQFTQMLKLIASEVKKQGWKHVYLDGSTKDREKVVEQFQEDPETSIFLISLKAGGVGLNLTAADYVFLYDPWWNEAVERQAIDRAHRLGKTGTVIARRYVTALSIEEKIMRLKEHKKVLSENLLEAEDGLGAVTLDDLLSLLN